MLRPALLLPTILSCSCLCSAQAVSKVQFESVLRGPMYESGYVLDWNWPVLSTLSVYGPSAKFLYTVQNRETDRHYFASAIDADGRMARAYHINLDRSEEGRIDVLDMSGQVLRTINTGSYQTTSLIYAPDHTLWTVGFVGCTLDDEFNVVRHYASTGEKLGEAVPWSQIQGSFNSCTALQPLIGYRVLFSANDRFGFIGNNGKTLAKWIEVGFDGKLLGQYDLSPYHGRYFNPRAMTSSGDVYAQIGENGDYHKGYAVLDRSSCTWRKVSGCPEGRLIGADGDNLVFAQSGDGATSLEKVAATALVVEDSETAAVAAVSKRN
jgi:hypothetical protein